ncbi:hypothetical protein BG003_008796 [Podila horticola]|nr:hypothetical protein BG003_008796 [Podila horticola]
MEMFRSTKNGSMSEGPSECLGVRPDKPDSGLKILKILRSFHLPLLHYFQAFIENFVKVMLESSCNPVWMKSGCLQGVEPRNEVKVTVDFGQRSENALELLEGRLAKCPSKLSVIIFIEAVEGVKVL